MHFELLDELVIIFLLSIVVNLVCNKIKLTATVGFLLTGVLCGPSLLGIVDSQSISDVAELGVAMLLFTIGMELSGEALSRLKRPVFLGGSLQIGLTVLAIAGLTALLDGTSLPSGIFWGCLVALSSSAIVLQIFQQKGLTSTPTGRLSLAILVFQDIMVAPMMLCVPLLSGQFHMAPLDMLLSVLKVGGILGAVLLAAHLGLNRFMEAVMRTRSRELLFLSTLGTCFGMALLTHSLGLSLSLGAFLAGLMLARSQYSMSVISGIMPYRDVFMSLFFISVGMMLDLSFFLQHIWAILFNTLLFILIKSLLTMPAVLVQGYPLRTAIQTSLCLAQVGEFSFVLAASGLAAGLLNDIGYQSFLALSVITMMLTPFLINLAPRAAALLTRGRGKEASSPEAEQQKTSTLKDHLIIVGFGISGKHLAQVAKESGIPYTILEMNPETVSRYKNKEPISHGDASQPVILEHLGVYTARVLAIIISEPAAVRAITLEARRMNPDLYIVARTRFITEVAPLRRLGANVVIAEEFETSIEVFNQVLTQYLVPRQDIDAFSARLRQQNYRMIRRMSSAADSLESVASRLPEMGVQTMRLEAGSPLCGLSLAQSNLRREYAVTVVAVARSEQEVVASPPADFVMEAGDLLYLFGKTDKLFAVKPVICAAPATPATATAQEAHQA